MDTTWSWSGNEAIERWLSPLDFTETQERYLGLRHPGTLDWFFSCPEYEAWLKDSSHALLVSGLPGTGKSVAASAVVSDISNRFQDQVVGGTAVAYLYLENDDKNFPQSLIDILGALIKRLLPGDTIPANIKEVYDYYNSLHRSRKKKRHPRPDLEAFMKLLNIAVHQYSRTFIVMDALDEIHEDVWDSFTGTLGFLRENPGVHAMATLGDHFLSKTNFTFLGATIPVFFESSPTDLNTYVEAQTLSLPSHIQEKPEVVEDIRQWMKANACSSFLAASSHLDLIADSTPDVSWEEALKRESHRLQNSIRKTMRNIVGQKDGIKEIALSTLAWLTYCIEPLSADELLAAVQKEVRDIEVSSSLGENCLGLICFEDSTNMWKFAYPGIIQYLREESHLWFTNAESRILSTCLDSLRGAKTWPSILERADLTPNALNIKRRRVHDCQTLCEVLSESRPLYRYAARNWGHHYKNTRDSPEKVTEFLTSGYDSYVSSGALEVSQGAEGPGLYGPNEASLYLAAYFDLDDQAETLLREYDMNYFTSTEPTPLWWALERKNRSVAQILCKEDNVTLYQLVCSEKEELVEDLLAYRRNRNQMSHALHLAVSRKHAEISEILLLSGADVEATGSGGITPLKLAFEDGNREGYSPKLRSVIYTLLEHSASSKEIPVHDWETALGLTSSSVSLMLTETREDKGRFITNVDRNSVPFWLGTMFAEKSRCALYIPWVRSKAPAGPLHRAHISWQGSDDSNSRCEIRFNFPSTVRDNVSDISDIIESHMSFCRGHDGYWSYYSVSTNLPKIWMPEDGIDLYSDLLNELEHRWIDLCNHHQQRLLNVRERIFNHRGNDPQILEDLLRDGIHWFALRTRLDDLVKSSIEFADEYGRRLHEREASKILVERIEKWGKQITLMIDRLDNTSRDLVQLEFNLVSIYEARKSTTSSASMNRLSWITFFFLPLTFVSGLFGMNVDILESNPSWWLYLVFASGTLILTSAIWVIFKRDPNLQRRIEQRFSPLIKPIEPELQDEIPLHEMRRPNNGDTAFQTLSNIDHNWVFHQIPAPLPSEFAHRAL
ncbi:hypothetical protein F5Y15DRAFT_35829 [Xylariaceae sp. FL0016]|nr:hypothetical protein F5Y15DRAFT_35829 [Xylariaceae sp. FL0016]